MDLGGWNWERVMRGMCGLCRAELLKIFVRKSVRHCLCDGGRYTIAKGVVKFGKHFPFSANFCKCLDIFVGRKKQFKRIDIQGIGEF